MLIFSIKNEKLGFFNRPIYVESSNEALSYIQNILMSDADRALHGLKNDLSLYQLGTIDFTTGKIVSKVRKICDLLDVFNSIPEDRIPDTALALSKRIKHLEDAFINKSEEVVKDE